jgi:hypothetical protein
MQFPAIARGAKLTMAKPGKGARCLSDKVPREQPQNEVPFPVRMT